MVDKQIQDEIVHRKAYTYQHGPYNNRVYLMHVEKGFILDALTEIMNVAHAHEYTKIFAKIPLEAKDMYLANNFKIEATVPSYYANGSDCLFVSLYLDTSRKKTISTPNVQHNIALALLNSQQDNRPLPPDANLIQCSPENSNEMADLYSTVFDSYPFPITDPDYLKETMIEGTKYVGVKHNESIVALASAEFDHENSAAEITDFASDPDFRGKGYASSLLVMLESILSKKNISTLFTIARSYSVGMNTVFAKNGYSYSGTLIQNTNIAGRFEEMNVWYKKATDIPF